MATRYEHYITDATGSDSLKTYWQAQTFTPQTNHTITHLTLRVYKWGSPGDLTVDIRNTYANWPDDTILASATVPAASIPQQAGAAINNSGIVVALDVPLDVIALTKYAIVLHKGGDSSNQYRWVLAFPGYYGEEIYVLGTLCYSYSGGGYENWIATGNKDFMFEEWNGKPSPSSVTTQAVSDIAIETATGNGNITSLGDSAYVYQYGHCWGESENPTVGSTNTVWKGEAPGTGAFTSGITGLSPGTAYHCRAFTVGMAGIVYGSDETFTTVAAPTVTTDPATAIEATIATLRGTLEDDGGEACDVRFQYGETIAYGIDTDWQSGKESVIAFEQAITGLDPNKTYHFRAQARNSAGTVNGADRTFTTVGHYSLNIKNINLSYEDLDRTKELHVLLKNLSPTAKKAGADGEVVVEVNYELVA